MITKTSMRFLASKGIVGHDLSRAIVVRELSKCRYSTTIVQQKDLVVQINNFGDGGDGGDGKEEEQRIRQKQ